MSSRLLKGHLDLMLLRIVADGPAHGYAVIEQLRQRSDAVFDLPEGTVYPALHRLERAGLLTSAWSTTGGRRRRVYHVSPRGRTELDRQHHDWRTFVTAVARVMQEEPWPSTP